MAASVYIAGYLGSAVFAGFTMNVQTWSATLQCEALETTSTGSNGFRQFIAGLQGGDIKAALHYDTANIPTSNGLSPSTVGTMKLYTTQTSFYSFSVLLTEVTPELKFDGLVEFAVSGKVTGQFTYPL